MMASDAPKPAGRLQTVEDIQAAIRALLERLRAMRQGRGAGRGPKEEPEADEDAEKQWPGDLNDAQTSREWGRDGRAGEARRG
jgi:hypothetical protein